MKKWSDKSHPLVEVAKNHKKVLKMKAESIDVVVSTPFRNPIVSTIKFDGEHNIISWTKGDSDCTVCNRGGTVRTDLNPTMELAGILQSQGYTEATFAGELYAIWENGKKMDLKDVMHHIKAPKGKEEESRIRIALFDIISLNGKPIYDKYWKKILLLGEILGSDTDYVHAVPAVQGDINVARDMWEHEVLEKGLEGLVIHSNGIIKVKVINTMDVAVIGMTAFGKRFEQGLASAFLVAFQAPDGTFLVSSHVGAAAKEKEQKEWYDWIMANKVGETVINNERHIMCKPMRILEVGANEWYCYENPKVAGYTFDGKEYKYAGMFPGVKGQKPRLLKDENGRIKERKDKSINPIDLRLTQAPDFDEKWLTPYMKGSRPKPKSESTVVERNRAALASIFSGGSYAPKSHLTTSEVEQKNKEVLKQIFGGS